MYNNMLRNMLVLVAVLLASPLFAGITGVTATPNSINLNDEGATRVTVRYRIDLTPSGGTNVGGGTVVIYGSNSGIVYIDGNPAATLRGVISDSGLFISPTINITATESERIRISPALAARIADARQGAYYERIFIGPLNNPFTVRIPINAATPPAEENIFRSISLNFDDESLFRTVPQNAAITARMRLTTNGRGRLDGHWEVSGPGPLHVFRRIGRIRRPLAGSRALIFESPVLPTDLPGMYAVRFVPTDPVIAASLPSIPQIQYSVQPIRGENTITQLGPRTGADVNATTTFWWEQMREANAYRVEFLSLSGGSLNERAQRVAAIDVPATQVATRLKPFTLARIGNARVTVYWRVLALDTNGVVVATSPLRPIGGT